MSEGRMTMMKKLLSAAILAAALSISAYAADSSLIYTEYKTYKANVYVCDSENRQVILRNVSALKPADMLAARNLEYTAIPVNPNGMYERNGNALDFDVINEFLLDREATVVVGRCGSGFRVVYMSI